MSGQIIESEGRVAAGLPDVAPVSVNSGQSWQVTQFSLFVTGHLKLK